MKTLLLLTTCLTWCTASFAQTTPANSTATTSPGSASGTKNVGADRADAPQAPGMTTADGTRSTSSQTRRTTRQQHTKQTPVRKQTTTQTSPQ